MRPAALVLLTCALAGCGSKPVPAPAPGGPAADEPAPPPAEAVENPQYRSWARFPVGTVAVQRRVSETEGVEGKTVTTQTTRLLEVTPEFVKLEEQSSSRRYDGYEENNPPGTHTVPSRLTLPPGVKKEDFGKHPGGAEGGEGTVTVAGRQYAARWYTGKDRNEGGEVSVKTWVSDEAPGRLLKSVSRTTGVNKIVTVELVEVRVP